MKGFRYRTAYCVLDGPKLVVTDHGKCNDSKPTEIKDCYKIEGCNPHWVPLKWGEVIIYCYGHCCYFLFIILV